VEEYLRESLMCIPMKLVTMGNDLNAINTFSIDYIKDLLHELGNRRNAEDEKLKKHA
jgi:hypothetical protein